MPSNSEAYQILCHDPIALIRAKNPVRPPLLNAGAFNTPVIRLVQVGGTTLPGCGYLMLLYKVFEGLVALESFDGREVE